MASSQVPPPTTFVRRVPLASTNTPLSPQVPLKDSTTRVGTGIRELDGPLLRIFLPSSCPEILGGSIPLHALILLEEDEFAQIHTLFTRYWLAESVASGEGLWLEGVLPTLPALDAHAAPEPQSSSQATPQGLQSAYQYGKYLDEASLSSQGRGRGLETGLAASLSTSRVPSHHFDLLKQMAAGTLDAHAPLRTLIDRNLDLSGDREVEARLTRLYASLLRTLERFNSTHEGKKVMRIALPSFIIMPERPVQYLRFLHALRGLLRSAQAVALVTITAKPLDKNILLQMEHLADVVIALDSFTGPLPTRHLLSPLTHLRQGEGRC